MIDTARLTLRKYARDDWAAVHEYASIPAFSEFEIWGPNTAADSKAFVSRCIEYTDASPIQRYELAVVLKRKEKLIGGCGLKIAEASAGEASLGYAIHPAYQQQGFATEVATALINFGFRRLKLARIFAECDTRNKASCRVMEKAGMARIATLQNHRQFKGQVSDSFLYEVLPRQVLNQN